MGPPTPCWLQLDSLSLPFSLNLPLCSSHLYWPVELRIKRQNSSDSISSLNSITSHSSIGSSKDADAKKKKKKSWVGDVLGADMVVTFVPVQGTDPFRIHQEVVPSSKVSVSVTSVDVCWEQSLSPHSSNHCTLPHHHSPCSLYTCLLSWGSTY